MSEFKEDDHPRDDDGKFTEGGSGGGFVLEKPSKPYDEDLQAHGGDHFTAAKEFYRRELQGKSVKASLGELGEKEVHFTGSNLKKIQHNMKMDPVKAELVQHVPDVLKTGKYLGALEAHKDHYPYVSFHYITKGVMTSVGMKEVIVDVGRRKDGVFEYSLYSMNHEGFKTFAAKKAQLQKNLPRGNKRATGSGRSVSQAVIPRHQADYPVVNLNISPHEGRVNIYIVGEDDAEDQPMTTILEKEFTNARIQNWRIDDDGMLRVTAHVLKEGVYAYSREESGAAVLPADIGEVQQYIPLAQFTEEALTSLEGKPVVINAHEWRDAENTLVDGLTVGTIAGRPEVTDGGCITCDMLIYDPETIEKIQDGDLIEVSAGYNGNLVMGDGDFAGRPYHGSQTELRFNHVLLLPEGMGRCGYDVRIINSRELASQKQQGAGHMPTTIKVTVANKKRSYTFQNEEDAAKAEEMLEEEKTFNAEAVEAAIAAKGELEGQIKELQGQLDEQLQELKGAQDELACMLTPEAQEAAAQELVDQKTDEDAIIEAETGNSDEDGADKDEDKEKEEFGNALKKCKSLAERRKVTVTRVMNMRGKKADNWTQDAFDGAFEILAANAKARPKADPKKVMNGSLTKGKGVAINNASNRERMLRPMQAKNAKPEANA